MATAPATGLSLAKLPMAARVGFGAGVILLAAIEFVGRRDLRDDLARKTPGAVEFLDHFPRGGLLLRVVKENYRAVLLAVVGPLAIELCGVVRH